jgi:ubiquinone/menaquinone biosynthesis C-methylase UbiE
MPEVVESQAGYSEIVRQIDQDPHNKKVWQKVIDIARKEEDTPLSTKGPYGSLPLDEMLTVAQRLRETDSLIEQYRILSGEASTGELWYDLVLGKVNDKLLSVMNQEVGNWKDRLGFPAGSRRWRKGLDLGTGTGNSLREMEKFADESVGVDLLDFLLPVARSRSEKSLLVSANALNLPFSDDSLDLIQSNGLTFYLPKEALGGFVSEVDRVLIPGGSYFQAYPLPSEEGSLAQTERGYLTNGKALLACLMDRLITSPYVEGEKEPSEFSLISQVFSQRGFTRVVSLYESEGVVVLEFRKKFPKEFERLKHIFFSGDDHQAEVEVRAMLYGNRAAFVDLDRLSDDDFLPTDKVIINLEYLEKLAQEQEIIEFGTLGDYFTVFIAPFIYLATNERYDFVTRTKASLVIAQNLERIKDGREFDINSSHWSIEGFRKTCEYLRESLRGEQGCEVVVQQIDEMLEGKPHS